MKIKTRFQLSFMMFLQYFIWGTWYITLNTYLGETLKFTGIEIGLSYGTFAIAAMISPFFVGLIADKFFSTEKVLGVMHLLGSLLFILTAQMKTFEYFYPCLLLYTLTYAPTMALSNSVSFHQMQDPGKQFPWIRVLGTFGWIAANQVIGIFDYGSSVNQLYVGAISSALLGVYSFSLPHVAPKKDAQVTFREIIGLDALSLFKKRAFAILFIASVLTCIPLSYYYSFTASFLSDIGMKMNWIPRNMSMGQMAEAAFLLVLPFFLKRYGIKNVFIIGMAAWLIRYLCFAYGDMGTWVWMIYLGILLHGLCYDFFFVAGQIYVDKEAPPHLKSSAQGMITFATYGLGMFIGTWFAGMTVDLYTVNGVRAWSHLWLIPAGIAAIVLVMFIFIFKEKKNQETSAPPS